jgi:hypothetical protein
MNATRRVFVIWDRVEHHFHKLGGGFTQDISEAKYFMTTEKAHARRLDSHREEVLGAIVETREELRLI